MHDPRSHLYRTIHKAVRSLLGQLSALACSTDFSAPAELQRLRERVKQDFAMLAAHAHHEDEFIRPLLEQHCPQIAWKLASAHEEQHAMMPALESALHEIDPTASDAVELGAEFAVALSRYVADQFDHMADEEMLAMPALYAALDDNTLLAVHDTLVASVPPDEMMRWFGYMLPALSRPERVGMLMGMRASAPREAFDAVVGLAQQVLSQAAFEELTRELDGGLTRAA